MSDQRTGELTLLAKLLGSAPIPPASENGSWFSVEERTQARRMNIIRFIKAGFTYIDGRLKKGHTNAMPSEMMPSLFGTPRFNPAKDAVALKMGAVFVGPNRYRLGSLILDAMGAIVDPAACPECGSLHGEFRWNVRAQSKNPNAMPWQQAWTYCRRCCTEEEQRWWEAGRPPMDIRRQR